MIPRFYEATEGRVLINGRDVRSLDVNALRDSIAVVPQKAVLFSGTVRSNLSWGKNDATDEEMWQALERAQAKEFILQKNGLDEPVSAGGKNFSGGQRQRLTIARALVRGAEILILDDSSSALDYATDAALRASLCTLPNSPTVFIISQRTSSIRHADLILVMEDGKLVDQGRHEELLARCEVYREIHESQFKKGGNEGISVSIKVTYVTCLEPTVICKYFSVCLGVIVVTDHYVVTLNLNFTHNVTFFSNVTIGLDSHLTARNSGTDGTDLSCIVGINCNER